MTESTLEAALLDAVKDPGCRPHFYRMLLEADVLVLGEVDDLREGDRQSIRIGQLTSEGRVYVPLFTSLERVREFTDEDGTVIGVNARAMFEGGPPGIHYVLNPGCSAGKEFTPEEIRSLLDGSIFREPVAREAEEDTTVFLGLPMVWPDDVVAALRSYFRRRESVRAAYLAQMMLPDSSDPPHLVIGIDVTGDPQAVIREAAWVANQTETNGTPIDFVMIEDGSTIADFMTAETEPFYRRA